MRTGKTFICLSVSVLSATAGRPNELPEQSRDRRNVCHRREIVISAGM